LFCSPTIVQTLLDGEDDGGDSALAVEKVANSNRVVWLSPHFDVAAFSGVDVNFEAWTEAASRTCATGSATVRIALQITTNGAAWVSVQAHRLNCWETDRQSLAVSECRV
jgi:hypothetical protein